ncbi:MAG: ATP-binding cassette domain-containing protein [Candidatus Kapabacteria bacterium]|nr:ATP-binding cassette domain-containing protein [Candidatus Kapabacteria bacterium]
MHTINVEHLSKEFKTPQKKEGIWGSLSSLFQKQYTIYKAVDDVSFSIEKGELVGMLGSNGAGKTTTLKILSGLLHPTKGTATVLGHTPWERHNDFRRRFSIVMGQRNQLWWDLPAMDSYLLNKEIYRIPTNRYKELVKKLSERLEIDSKLSIQLRRLSLGERMKCELIGALLHEPEVVYLDEPTIGLDVVAQHSLREFVKEYNKEHDSTIILTSHYMEDIVSLCKRVIILDKGKIFYDGNLEKLSSSVGNDKIVTLHFKEEISSEMEASLSPQFEKISSTTLKARISKQEAPNIVSSVLQSYPIDDINLEEVPIEEVIREIFQKK